MSVVPLNRMILPDLQKFNVKKETKICIQKYETADQLFSRSDRMILLGRKFSMENTNANNTK